MTDPKSDDFEDRLRNALLKETGAPLTPEVAGRLAAIRRRAMLTAENSGQSQTRPRTLWLLWGGMTTAVAGLLLAAAVSLRGPETLVPVFEEQAFAAVEDLELLEDLEFLAWLETEEEGGAG